MLLRGRTREEVLAGVRTRRRDLDVATTADVPQVAAVIRELQMPGDLPCPDDGESLAFALTDQGVDARAAFAAVAEDAPTVPNLALPPGNPGRPVALPLDPPA